MIELTIKAPLRSIYTTTHDKVIPLSNNLIKPKIMREYIEKYIDRKYREINGRLPISYEEEDTIIKIEGSTEGMKYNRYGI